jgi:hypothetical protein
MVAVAVEFPYFSAGCFSQQQITPVDGSAPAPSASVALDPVASPSTVPTDGEGDHATTILAQLGLVATPTVPDLGW